jgi:hypothetical protein
LSVSAGADIDAGQVDALVVLSTLPGRRPSAPPIGDAGDGERQVPSSSRI